MDQDISRLIYAGLRSVNARGGIHPNSASDSSTPGPFEATGGGILHRLRFRSRSATGTYKRPVSVNTRGCFCINSASGPGGM